MSVWRGLTVHVSIIYVPSPTKYKYFICCYYSLGYQEMKHHDNFNPRQTVLLVGSSGTIQETLLIWRFLAPYYPLDPEAGWKSVSNSGLAMGFQVLHRRCAEDQELYLLFPESPPTKVCVIFVVYRIYSNCWHRQAWANSTDLGLTSDQGLHCLPLIRQFKHLNTWLNGVLQILEA